MGAKNTSVIAALIGMVAFGGCGDSGGEDFEFTRATDTQVKRLVESRMGATPRDNVRDEIEGQRRVRGVECVARRSCVVRYVADQPLDDDDAEAEILEAQRPVWRGLFSDRRVEKAKLVAVGSTVSPGGKTSISPVLELACDRAAHRQIDWGNVTAEGMRELCDYQPLVSFD